MLNRFKKEFELFASILVLLLCYLILVGNSLGPQSALDTYWHLQMGRDLLSNGLSPFIDHYSFTFNGEKISSPPVLFQITLASLVSTYGEIPGFMIYKVSYVTILLLGIFLFLRQTKTPWFVICIILPILTYFINMRLIIRPETISNILIIICLSLYIKARKNFNKKELASICILLLFWTNYHSPIFGYIIIFGLFIDRAINKIQTGSDLFSWNQWFLWGSIIFLIGFINPTLNHPVLDALFMTNDWNKFLSEYSSSQQFYSTNKMVYLLWITSIYATCWAAIKKHYGFAIITVVFAYNSWLIIRLIPTASLIIFCILAYLLSEVKFRDFTSKISQPFQFILVIFSASLFFFSLDQILNKPIDRLLVLKNYSSHIQNMRQLMKHSFPDQASDYLKTFHKGGNIINDFNTGGYLIYALPSTFKIFIDGRTNILYPIEFYKHYIDTITNVSTLEHDINKYNIQYALFRNTPKAQLYFSGTDALSINYADDNFVIFSNKKEISFPISSKLTLFPMCWNKNLHKQIDKEIALSKSLLSDKQYEIKFILNLLDNYLSHNDKYQYLNEINHTDLTSESIKRLASYLAINQNNYKKSADFIKLIKNKSEIDYLMIAYISTIIEDYPTSITALSLYLSKKEPISKDLISNYEKVILHKTLTMIQQKNAIDSLSDSVIKQIEEEFKIDKNLYYQSLSPKFPYHEACRSIFKSY
ncbi:MAG: hypothetical protein OEZ38_02290 [Gammaproteobacteria bacterium]|nr:hypothetical protein [Gammaproteobacteria bacterium]